MAVPGQYTKSHGCFQTNGTDLFGNSDSGGAGVCSPVKPFRISQAAAEWAELVLSGKPGAAELAQSPHRHNPVGREFLYDWLRVPPGLRERLHVRLIDNRRSGIHPSRQWRSWCSLPVLKIMHGVMMQIVCKLKAAVGHYAGFCVTVAVDHPRSIQSSVSGFLSNATIEIFPSRSCRCTASAAPSPPRSLQSDNPVDLGFSMQ